MVIAMVSIFSAILNKNGESGQPCLVSDLQGKALKTSLSIMIQWACGT